jgi:hypothetical protein
MNTTPQTAARKWPARLLADVLVVLPSVLRIFPYIKPPNFQPVGALSLLGGARQPLWQALLTPMLVMVVTDLLLERMFGWTPFNPFVYGCFAAMVLLGRLLRRTNSPLKIGSASLAGSTLFYLVTNFGVWYMSRGKPNALYAPTLDGLLICYRQGLYFFGLTVLGDLGFCFVLFGAYDWLTKPALGEKRAPIEEIAR